MFKELLYLIVYISILACISNSSSKNMMAGEIKKYELKERFMNEALIYN